MKTIALIVSLMLALFAGSAWAQNSLGSGSGGVITTGSLATVQGNGTKVQLSTGTTTTNDCVKFDASGNTVDNGSACGSGSGSNPIFTHTLTAGTTATMVVNSGTVAATDVEYEAPTGNGTWTFPAAMGDGEIILFDEQLAGTARSNTFAKGTLVTTFASDVTGDTNTAPGTPAACGTVPATGDAWFRWQYTSSSTTMTLLGCGIDPPGAVVSTTLGGTGANLSAAASGTYPKANGSGAYAASTLAASGVGSCTNQAVTALNGDAAPTCTTLTSSYVDTSIAKTGTDINTSNQVTTTHLAAALPVAQGGTALASGTSGGILGYTASGTLASSAALTSNVLVKGGGAGATPTNSSITDNGTTVSSSEPRQYVESTAPAGIVSSDLLYGDSTAHRLKMINNNGTAAQLVASGADINTSDQVTVTHLSAALPVNQGGTGSTTGGLFTTSSTNSSVFGLGFDFIGTPTASMIEATNLVHEISVPANYATPTSSCTCGTNPAETDAYTVKCNGTSQGTFSLSTSCVLTLPTNSAYTCTAGQRFEMDAPATVSGKDIACTVAYTR